MIQKFALFVAAFCLVSVMAVPMPAQSFSVKANVPFAFVVAGKTMPAGEYALDNEVPAVTAVRLRNLDSREAAVASTNPAGGGMAAAPGGVGFPSLRKPVFPVPGVERRLVHRNRHPNVPRRAQHG